MKRAASAPCRRTCTRAIRLAEQSELLRRTLGDHVFEKLIENKKIEWDRFKMQVTTWELEQCCRSSEPAYAAATWCWRARQGD